MNPEQFIEAHIKLIKPIFTNAQNTYWKASLSGKEEDFKKYEALSKEISKIYNDKEKFKKVKKLNEQNISSPLIKRQIQILYDNYLSGQGDIELIHKIIEKSTSVEQKFNIFRAKVDGKELTDNEIKEILKTEINSKKLQTVWEASKKQGAVVEKELIEIIKLRNQLAKSLGFKNYYEMSLITSEQNVNELTNIFKELDNSTKESFGQLKKEMDKYLSEKYSCSTNQLKPWHYQDLFFQEGPKIYDFNLDEIYSKKDIVQIAKKFYNSIGIDVEDILSMSDLYEKPGKSQHAYCINIDREGDVRILQNVKNNEYWMGTTLHELGHAIYEKNFGKTLPFILKDTAHIFVTEAIAMLFGRQAKNISFIKNYFGIDETKAKSLSQKIADSLKLEQLVFSRWVQVMFNFERELYKNPEQNLNKLWYEVVNKYQMLNFSRDHPDWASKIHLVSSPVYYHNYMLGEMFASQLHHQITKNILKQNSLKNIEYSNNRKIGKFLIENIFKPGKSLHYNELIKKATGESLVSKYFMQEFVSQ